LVSVEPKAFRYLSVAEAFGIRPVHCQLVSLDRNCTLQNASVPRCLYSDVAMHDDTVDVSDTEEQKARSISTSAPSRTNLESSGGGMSVKRKASVPVEPSDTGSSIKNLRGSGML